VRRGAAGTPRVARFAGSGVCGCFHFFRLQAPPIAPGNPGGVAKGAAVTGGLRTG